MASREKDRVLGTFGRTVRDARHKAGLTQEELAHKAKLHPRFIGMIERAERNCTLQTIVALSQALGTPPKRLLEGL